MRPQPPVERGWADKADSRPPLRGPGGWGGDWYVWHAPDGLRARAATGLGCVQAGAQKLGVLEASYASAIIGVDWPPASSFRAESSMIEIVKPRTAVAVVARKGNEDAFTVPRYGSLPGAGSPLARFSRESHSGGGGVSGCAGSPALHRPD